MVESDRVNITSLPESKIEVNNISHNVFQVANSDGEFDILLDTGASIHIIHNINLFSKIETISSPKLSYLEMADGTKSSNLIEGRGTALIPALDLSGTKHYLK